MYNTNDSHTTLTNSILWGNTAPDGPQIYNHHDSSFVITYNDIQSGWPGEGNIDEDPLFVRDPNDGGDGWGDDPATHDIDEGANDDYGDLHLQPGSPCIDAGNNVALPLFITTDLDGNPRIVNDIVDMGAYELHMILLSLDIKPGDCPNPLNTNTRGKGRLPMAILGTEFLDVNEINADSIKINDDVLPVHAPKIEDVSFPAEGEDCACHIADPDGRDDMVIHFMRRDVIIALGLDEFEVGTVVPITVRGTLQNGIAFKATDCVELVGRKD